MQFQHFNDGWFCRHLEETGPGLPVSIPDDAMLREPRSATSMGGLNVSWFEGRDYAYTKTFSLTEEQLRAACFWSLKASTARRRSGSMAKRQPSAPMAIPISTWT